MENTKELEKIKEAKSRCRKCAIKMGYNVECNVEDTECNDDCPFLKYLEEN